MFLLSDININPNSRGLPRTIPPFSFWPKFSRPLPLIKSLYLFENPFTHYKPFHLFLTFMISLKPNHQLNVPFSFRYRGRDITILMVWTHTSPTTRKKLVWREREIDATIPRRYTLHSFKGPTCCYQLRLEYRTEELSQILFGKIGNIKDTKAHKRSVCRPDTNISITLSTC